MSLGPESLEANDSASPPPADEWADRYPVEGDFAKTVPILPRDPARMIAAIAPKAGPMRDEGLRISSHFDAPVRARDDDRDDDDELIVIGRDHVDTEDEEVVRLSEPYAETAFRTIPQPPDDATDAGTAAALSGRRRRHAEWGLRKKQNLRWLVASGAGVLALLVVALVIQQRWLTPAPDPLRLKAEVVEEEPVPEVEGFEISGTSQRESMDLLTRFAHARTPADALPLIRDNGRLAELVRDNWRPWEVPAGWTTPLEASWMTNDDSGKGFGLLVGSLPDLMPFRAYFVREKGAIKLDWEATTAYSATDFGRLVRGSGMGGITRVYMEPDHYYTLVFPEESYRCFKLLSPDMTKVIWGYAARGSRAEKAIHHYFPTGLVQDPDESVRAMTLTLEPAPKGAQPNQWLISRMHHHEWVAP